MSFVWGLSFAFLIGLMIGLLIGTVLCARRLPPVTKIIPPSL
jgi:hypothetical protein